MNSKTKRHSFPFTLRSLSLLSFVFIMLLLLTNCGGSISDEQRKKFKEGMEQHKILKLSDAEIMSAALEKGQSVFKELKLQNFENDSLSALEEKYQVDIHFVVPGKTDARAIEQELIEAYINGLTTNSTQDNLQKIWTSAQRTRYDSLVYSKPQLIVRPDGVEELEGLWNIYMAKKDVVMSFAKKK